jgi:hypothetical protein
VELAGSAVAVPVAEAPLGGRVKAGGAESQAGAEMVACAAARRTSAAGSGTSSSSDEDDGERDGHVVPRVLESESGRVRFCERDGEWSVV